jgi:hypothetical protein
MLSYVGFSNSFFENQGEYPDSVLYYHNSKNISYLICENSIIASQHELISNDNEELKYKLEKQSLSFKNANKLTQINPKFKSKNIKFTGNKKIISYQELLIKDIYSSIDLRIYFDKSYLRFDLIANPGSIPENIEMVSSENFENNINSLNNKLWGLEELYTHQDDIEISSNFILDDNSIKFDIGNYDFTKPLIIDPVLYSSYIGGLDIDSGEDLVIDNNGSIIIVGETVSLNFPTTVGSFQENIKTGSATKSDVFVTKVDANYNHIFTTYLGSSGDDFGRSIDVDEDGNIYITGYTSDSEDFPTRANSFDRTYNGLFDVFVSKLSPDGTNLLASTLLGGNRDDFALALDVLKNGNVAITGYTTQAPDSAAFPTTEFSFGEIYLGMIDGFVSVFDEDLTSLEWSGLIGGLEDDFPQDIISNDSNDVFITGTTRSTNYPTTDGVLYRNYNDNNLSKEHSDIFLTKIQSNGRSVVMSSIFGGSNRDVAYGIKLDGSNNIYITGETKSSNLPTTDGAPYRDINQGNDGVFASDVFFSKFNSDASELLFSSYLGGESSERAFDLDLDGFNNAYLIGTTSSQNFPVSGFAYDDKLNDSIVFSDVFISKFNALTNTLSYSTYFGGERSDIAKSLKLRSTDRLVFTGNTSSTFFETTNDAIQVAYQDSSKADAYFTEIFLEDLDNADIILCAGESTTLNSDITSTTMTLTYSWSPAATLDNPNLQYPTATPTISTLYTCRVTNQIGEVFIGQVYVGVLRGNNVQITGPLGVDNNVEYIYGTGVSPGTSYQWIVNNGTITRGQGTNNVNVRWSNAEFGSLRLISTNSFGCRDTATIFTRYVPQLPWDVYPFGPYEFCIGDTILLDAGPEFEEVIWQDGVSGRYDTVYTSGFYSFTGRYPDNTQYSSPEVFIDFKEVPRKPTIIISEVTGQLVCISASENYYWFKDGQFIQGNNSRFLNPFGFGCYQVSIENIDSCRNLSDDFCITPSNIENNNHFKIYPNPAEDILNIEINIADNINEVRIINTLGETVYQSKIYGRLSKSIELTKFAKGIYLINLNGFIVDKIVKI